MGGVYFVGTGHQIEAGNNHFSFPDAGFARLIQFALQPVCIGTLRDSGHLSVLCHHCDRIGRKVGYIEIPGRRIPDDAIRCLQLCRILGPYEVFLRSSIRIEGNPMKRAISEIPDIEVAFGIEFDTVRTILTFRVQSEESREDVVVSKGVGDGNAFVIQLEPVNAADEFAGGVGNF